MLFLGYKNILIHAYYMPNAWRFISCSIFFIVRCSLFINHDYVKQLHNITTHSLVPFWAHLFRMMLVVERTVCMCTNFLNGQNHIGTLCRSYQRISFATRSCILPRRVTGGLTAQSGLTCPLFKFNHFGGQGLDQTSEAFNIVCVLFLGLAHRDLRPLTCVLGLLSGLIVCDDSNCV